MVIMKSGKKEKAVGIELPRKKIGVKENYKYFGILKADIIKKRR